MPSDQVRWKLSIDAVDGDTFYCMGIIEEHKSRLIKFLELHDHEGSSLTLEIYGPNMKKAETIFNPEEIYKRLNS